MSWPVAGDEAEKLRQTLDLEKSCGLPGTFEGLRYEGKKTEAFRTESESLHPGNKIYFPCLKRPKKIFFYNFGFIMPIHFNSKPALI